MVWLWQVVCAHSRRFPRLVLWIIGVSLVLRIGGLAWIYLSGNASSLVYGDAVGYIQLAQNLVQLGSFGTVIDGVYTAEVFRAPGLPVLLAPFVAMNMLWLYQYIQALMSAVFLPVLTWSISRRFFLPPVAMIATALVAFEPNLIFFSWLPLSEAFFILFSMGALYLFLKAQETQSRFATVVAGLIAGYAILIKPGMWPILLVALLCTFGYWWYVGSRKEMTAVALIFVSVLIVIGPWMVRNHTITGSLALSGSGWRNIYTDYLASVYALENGTMFWDEKAKLKDVTALNEFGLTRFELNSPAHSAILRDYSLRELWAHRTTVMRLESMILLTFFTNDSYFSYFSRFGFIEPIIDRISPSYVLLTEGVSGIPKIVAEMQRQWFLPILGRAIFFGITLLAIFGWAVSWRNPSTWFLVMVIGLWALASTVIGLGVEARLRLPVQPYIFMLAAVGTVAILSYYREFRSKHA